MVLAADAPLDQLEALPPDLVGEQACSVGPAQAAQRGEGEAASPAASQEANLGDPVLDAARRIASRPARIESA